MARDRYNPWTRLRGLVPGLLLGLGLSDVVARMITWPTAVLVGLALLWLVCDPYFLPARRCVRRHRPVVAMVIAIGVCRWGYVVRDRPPRVSYSLKETAEQYADGSTMRQNIVERLYPACDVTVLPSASEGTSNALLESMACGYPWSPAMFPTTHKSYPTVEAGTSFPSVTRPHWRIASASCLLMSRYV